MKLTTSLRGDVTVLAVSGELNADTVNRLNKAVAEAFASQHRDFIVDLGEVTNVDSTGLEALTALQRQCDDQLGMVRFCGADETLQKIFEITRLTKQFALSGDVDEALSAFVQG